MLLFLGYTQHWSGIILGSLLRVHSWWAREPYVMSEIKPVQVACKAKAVLLLLVIVPPVLFIALGPEYNI